jgi:hypothetical protein
MCTWNFRVTGAQAGPARVTFTHFGEQGGIEFRDTTYLVVKQGPMSGHWTLERKGEVYCEARKPSVLVRSFNLLAGEVPFEVRAKSPLFGACEIRYEGERVGVIKTVHPLTRRSTVECDLAVPELVQLFAFWLAALLWRRSTNQQS